MITIENADKALKDYYLKAVSAQLNDNVSPFFAAIEKSSADVCGKDVKIAVVRGGIDGVKASDEDETLPDPGANRYLDITVPLKNIYGTIQISDKALRASRESTGAFVNLVNAEMEGLVSAAKYNFQRMLYGDGNGLLCNVVSVGGDGKVFTVDSAKDYFVGLYVDVTPKTPGGESGNTGLLITAVDKVKKTVTLQDAPTGTFEGGKISIHGIGNKELTGLASIFSEDKLYSYDRNEESYFKPRAVTLSSALTEGDLTDMLDCLEENFNSKVNMILCSYATRKKIADLIADGRRVVNGIDARTGFGVVTVNDVPVYADKFCPEGTIYFINTDDFVLSQLCDWEWLEDEDGKILKQIPGKAAYSATLVKYAELICKKPCAQGVIRNV